MTLPAYLQQYQAPDVGAALSANLGSAMPPHVSIGGGRFTLIDASNNEIPVPTFDPTIGVYLDACIVDVNEHMSRQYFSKPYDPSAPGERPDCYSDNGSAPSISAPTPQSPTCAACPQAVWGSKISAQGNKIPACTQKQKMALLVPGFPTLFLLAVPPNSHSYLREYTERAKGNQMNLANVVTRISFVPGVQGTLQFAPVNYIDEPTAKLRQAAYAEKKTDALVGRNDVPRPAGAIAPSQAMVPALTPMLGALTMEPAKQMAPVQQVQQPAPFVPPASATAPMQQFAPSTPVAAVMPTAASPSEPPTTGRRKRRTAAEIQAAQGQPSGGPANQAPPQAPFPVSNAPGALPGQLDAFGQGQATAPTPPAAGSFGIGQGQAVAADPGMSQMLDSFFGGPK